MSEVYNEDYFERGITCGISGYMNYSWMPELTLRMAHRLIFNLPLKEGEKVLDFGCAKGFLVRALRLLDIDAYGVDISAYAISQTPKEVDKFCRHISKAEDAFDQAYDWLIAKDVFEHIPEAVLPALLKAARGKIRRMFLAIPLGLDDISGKFIIPAYNMDVTHVTIKTALWWQKLFIENGFKVTHFSYSFKGVKENWTQAAESGNGFFIIEGEKS